MPKRAVEGGGISFVKDINKDISLNVEGSEFSNDNGDGHLTLKDADLAFLKIDYNAFRKYFDNTGGVYPGYYKVNGAKLNSPDLQMDISYFKLETGIGPITDPFVDFTYEHNSKDGDKSLEQWASAQQSTGNSKKIAPSFEAVNDTVDRFTLKENKVFAGITIKGDQSAEIDYNHNVAEMPSVNPGNLTTINLEDESPDAKMFGAGVRAEKWMLNDNTYAGLGYHYNHVHDTDLMQNQTQSVSAIGVVGPITPSTGWNYSHALEDDHVWVGNLNTNLTPNLTFLTDVRYEHMGSEGESTLYSNQTTVDAEAMENHQDHEGEHVELRYSGISHTSLFAESNMEQERNWDDESFSNTAFGGSTANNLSIDRLNRTQTESWTVGGEIVPNRFFIFKTKVDQKWERNNYDTISLSGNPYAQTFLDSLDMNTIEEASSVTWKPYHWVQNSLKYQYLDTVYKPQQAALSYKSPMTAPINGQYGIAENHMLSSIFTYDITVEPIDPLLLMFTYSHVENYVRTVGASGTNSTSAAFPYIPVFNSGDNSFLFSDSYTPLESLTWTNTMCYTISDNYVNFNTGVPSGSDFKEFNFTTELDWSYHKWLKIGPSYEYAAYKEDQSSGLGNYSANIFKLTAKFSW